jgi:hypothetical protein
MFVAIAVALVLLVFAMMVPPDRLVIALVSYFACAWMMITAVLLAIYDLLVVRREARAERERLQRPLD